MREEEEEEEASEEAQPSGVVEELVVTGVGSRVAIVHIQHASAGKVKT